MMETFGMIILRVESYDFKGFVIVEYDGSHYNLVSYNDKTFFLPENCYNLIEKNSNVLYRRLMK